MQLSDFNFELPPELVADYPAPDRSGSRLLCLDTGSGSMEHRRFRQLPQYLRAGDLLVFNDTRVIPARLTGHKESGGRVEVLIERVLTGNRVLAQLRASKSTRAGTRLRFTASAAGIPDSDWVQVLGREGEFFLLQFPAADSLEKMLASYGHVPLPPYIRRADEELDRERYQTVYARHAGAVAAPTAGLHFDEALLDELARKGVDRAFLTLHVGAGTFQPVRTPDIADHRMHKEWLELDQQVCDQIQACRQRGGRVIAVGTTVVRSLESAVGEKGLQPFQGDTDIFIYPGHRFQVVDAMITNFHLPQSTLLMLVCAFAGKKKILDAYREAVARGYRFFSYGDSMFIDSSEPSGPVVAPLPG